jgi:hypothetical protein
MTDTPKTDVTDTLEDLLSDPFAPNLDSLTTTQKQEISSLQEQQKAVNNKPKN